MGFYDIWSWQQSLSCDLDHLNKLSFLYDIKASYEIWLLFAQLFFLLLFFFFNLILISE